MTDPDCRAMSTAGNMVGVVGYNVQTAVDTKNYIIVAHKTTSIGTDRGKLTPIAKLARE
ncbi:MAG: hypothetical protein GY781_03885 [Gammaproteobacteria bacterium]|nr:hypothetical protein [Gammaproteobacteria bacterium]